MLSIIRPRGDIKSNWENNNPILNFREWGVEWETTVGVGEIKIKIGDGITPWNNLEYALINNITKKIVGSFASVAGENPELTEGSSIDVLWAVTKKKFDYFKNKINAINTMIGVFSNITINTGGNTHEAVSTITDAIKKLNSGKLTTADIYDGIDSTNLKLALSANRGRLLNEAINSLNGNLSQYYVLQGGIYIPENANLDNYKTPGNYYCDSSALVPTIVNCPSASAFTMKVEYSVGNAYPAQIIRQYNTGDIFYRFFTSTQNKWIPWIKYITNTDLNPEVYIVPKPSNNSVFTFINTFQVSVRKSGKVVTIQLNISASMAAAGDFVTAFTIPQKYKPLTDVVINYIVQNTNKSMVLFITRDGEVKFSNLNSAINDWLCRQCVTYVTN